MGVVAILATGERLVGRGTRTFEGVLSDLLRTARREIQIVVYRFDTSALPLLELLEDAMARGVRVTAVVSSMEQQPEAIRERLKALAPPQGSLTLVDFAEKRSAFLHAKLLVVDRKWAVQACPG